MKNNKHYVILSSLIMALALVSGSLKAYVHGYVRLYHKQLGRTIDILFDYHIAEKIVSHQDFRNNSIDDLKRHVYETDAFVLHMLENLNTSQNEPVTLVWETSPAMNPKVPIVMSYGERLIKDRLYFLNYVHADTWRREGNRLIRKIINEHDPLHDYLDVQSIDRISKQHLHVPFGTLKEETLDGIRTYYAPHKFSLDMLDYEVHYRNNEHFSKLADLEMLVPILSSADKRIILNAGAAHSLRIADFLCTHAGYEQVYSKFAPGDQELPVADLSAGLQMPTVPQPAMPNNDPRAEAHVPDKQENVAPTVENPEEPVLKPQVKPSVDILKKNSIPWTSLFIGAIVVYLVKKILDDATLKRTGTGMYSPSEDRRYSSRFVSASA